jgi:hypothetical protein
MGRDGGASPKRRLGKLSGAPSVVAANESGRTVSKTYQFLSKWTKIDAILCIYSQRLFETMARKYDFGPRASIALGCLSGVMAAVFVICAVAISSRMGKQLYLETYGIAARANITVQSIHIDFDRRSGRHTQWRDIKYEFTTQDGQRIASHINRPVQELTSIPAHENSFTTAYWEWFPSVNLPQGFRFKAFELIALASLLAALALHFSVSAWRFFAWRRLSAGGCAEKSTA